MRIERGRWVVREGGSMLLAISRYRSTSGFEWKHCNGSYGHYFFFFSPLLFFFLISHKIGLSLFLSVYQSSCSFLFLSQNLLVSHSSSLNTLFLIMWRYKWRYLYVNPYLSIYLSICLSIYIIYFRLFTTT